MQRVETCLCANRRRHQHGFSNADRSSKEAWYSRLHAGRAISRNCDHRTPRGTVAARDSGRARRLAVRSASTICGSWVLPAFSTSIPMGSTHRPAGETTGSAAPTRVQVKSNREAGPINSCHLLKNRRAQGRSRLQMWRSKFSSSSRRDGGYARLRLLLSLAPGRTAISRG